MNLPTAQDDRPQDRQIADAIIEDIVEWRILPGAWLREREISTRFNVSHAPVREAFRHVANTGFISIVPWRGAHVIDIDRHTVTEIFELWKALFAVVCRFGAMNLQGCQHDELRRRIHEYRALVTRTCNTFEHLSASNRIGAYIARYSGATFASALLDRIALFARWQHHVIAEDYFSDRAGRESADLYEALVEAVIARDGDWAAHRAHDLLQHLQNNSAAPLEAYLRKRSSGAEPEPGGHI